MVKSKYKRDLDLLLSTHLYERSLSFRLLLAIEREKRPELTIEILKDEIANESYQHLTLPQLEEWQMKGVTSTYHAYCPTTVKVCVDVLDMCFEATVIIDAFSPESGTC